MENQSKYFKASPASQNKLFGIPKLRIILITIIWLILFYALIVEWLTQHPRIVQMKKNLPNSFDKNLPITLLIESKQLQNFDNILILSYQSNNNKDLKYLSINSTQLLNISSSVINLQICNSQIPNIKCAPIEQINEILSELIEINFIFQLQQYDYLNDAFEKIQKSIKLQIHKNNQLNGLIDFKVSQYNIEKQFKQEKYTILSDFNFIGTSINLSTLNLAQIKLEYDEIIDIYTINFEKIHNLLLSLVTITVICCYLHKLIKCFLNIKKQQKLNLKVLSYYFPELLNYKIQLNCFGKIINVKANSDEIDTKNVKWMRQFVQNYSQSIKWKLKIKNLIYQISRLQFICQSLQQRELIMNVHKVGIKLKLQEEIQNETQSNFELNDSDDPVVLRCQDINLLNMQNIAILLGECQNSFYKRNQIQMMNKKFWLI